VARFRALFDAHQRDLLAYVSRRALPGADGADVVAEVFATVWRRLDRVPPGPAARPYLFAVAGRALANAQRGLARRHRLLALLGRQPAPAPVADHAEAGAEVAAVRAAFAQLPPGQREVLALVVWEGLSTAEVAEVLGCRPNTVQVRLSRARRRLRQLMSEPAPQLPRGETSASRSR
jgi:RNA polymerase sigma-70 factor (ECF subfamily)